MPVPFSREMEHVKHYLHLEQIRFGDDLHVEYDIQEDDFFLPTLTIQPIVENAVKYGVGNKEEGGTVWIESHRMTELGSMWMSLNISRFRKMAVHI